MADSTLDRWRGASQQQRLLQVVQPGLIGLIDGTVSTLAPIFAAAYISGSRAALLVGLAAGLAAAVPRNRAGAGWGEGEPADIAGLASVGAAPVRLVRLIGAKPAPQLEKTRVQGTKALLSSLLGPRAVFTCPPARFMGPWRGSF